MNGITRSVLIGLLTADSGLTQNERVTLRRLIEGLAEESREPTNAPPPVISPIKSSPIAAAATSTPSPSPVPEQPVLLMQRDAAKILGVSRVTIWRMTHEGILHPVELLSGTVRYRREEIMTLAKSGRQATAARTRRGRRGADSVG